MFPLNPNDIDNAVYLLAFLSSFCVVTAFSYSLLLVCFAYPHHSNGYGWIESFGLALKELS